MIVSPEAELADVIRELIAATGCSLRELRKMTRDPSSGIRQVSSSSWSAYQSKKDLRVIPREALEWLLEVPSSTASATLKRRARRLREQIKPPRAQLTSCSAPDVGVQRDGSSRTFHRCRQYRVHQDGNVVDAAKNPIGAVVAGDLFTREDSADHPHSAYRYYGTVTYQGYGEGGVRGYVLKEKLTYLRTIRLGDGDEERDTWV